MCRIERLFITVFKFSAINLHGHDNNNGDNALCVIFAVEFFKIGSYLPGKSIPSCKFVI